MKGKRTGIEFEEHQLLITEHDGILVHYLKKPDTIYDNIKFINTNGILAVTGDYSNWMFCREFHPTADGSVSDYYWIEKLKIASCQEPEEFDSEETEKEIKRLLAEEEDLDDQEKEYLEECLRLVEDKFDYEHYAHRENCGRFQDHEYVPYCNKITDMSSNWYLAHFRTFEETNLKSNAKYLTKIFFKCICNIHTTIKRTYRTNLFNIFRFNITGFVLISKY